MQPFSRFSDCPPEKLPGKLLGSFPPPQFSSANNLSKAWMTGECCYIAALSNAFDNFSRRAWLKRTSGKHSRNFLRPREGALPSAAPFAQIFRAQGKQRSGIDRRVFGFGSGIRARSREVNNLGNSTISE